MRKVYPVGVNISSTLSMHLVVLPLAFVNIAVGVFEGSWRFTSTHPTRHQVIVQSCPKSLWE
jgi:hypothetical protein